MPRKHLSRLVLITATLVAAATGVTVAGVTSSGATTASAPTLPRLDRPGRPPQAAPDATATAPANSCGYQAAIPADRFKGIPVFNATKAAQPYTVKFFTTQGVITVKMLTSQAPCTTFSFRFLASQGYYNLTHCHRLTTEGIYVLQCGDPTGTGAGGPGYEFNDENLAGATYPAGTVAMANAGPNTNGSQFFICWKDTTLPPLYTPFGKVTSGLKVLQKIATAGDDQQNGPGDGYPNLYVGILAVPTIT